MSAASHTFLYQLRCLKRPQIQRPVFQDSRRFASSRAPANKPTRLIRTARATGYFLLGVGAIYAIDDAYNASALFRNLRTLWTCAVITADYKINFTPEKSESIPQLHERVAERMFHLFTANGGLYIKIGQAIGANAALLPKPMQEKFAKLFDDAPQIPYSEVAKVFRSEFGCTPQDIFDDFDEQAVASASIAQVHKARIKGTDQWVAVKVQKPAVNKQTEWDLGAYRLVMWMFENWLFDLPVYFVVDFVSDHLRQELDFVREAQNATRTKELVSRETRLSSQVYIPTVFPEFSSKRIMTAEWIDGVRLSDRPALRRLMGEEPPLVDSVDPSRHKHIAPGYDGPPLKGGMAAVMKPMVDLFSAQMFSWGFCHCDPHPGNVFIRPHPSRRGVPQLVLIDHGLYVKLPDRFRREYAMLWKGMLSGDFSVIKTITEDWGIGMPDLFTSAILMRPAKFSPEDELKGLGLADNGVSNYERSIAMKERLKGFLLDTDKMPKELIFLSRNMRIVQGNNQSLGSPVNRIKVIGLWASRSLATSPDLSAANRLTEYVRYVIFRTTMFMLDLSFWATRLRQTVREYLGMSSQGYEDELEKNMRGFAKSTFGVEIQPGMFEG